MCQGGDHEHDQAPQDQQVVGGDQGRAGTFRDAVEPGVQHEEQRLDEGQGP